MDTTVIILLAVAGIGILNTIYVSYHTYKQKMVACPIFKKESCETVQKSPLSKTFGVPNSYLGLSMLILTVILTMMYWKGLITFIPAFIVISAGFLFSIYFLYIQSRVLKAFCTWCVLSILVFTTLFIIGCLII